MAQNKAFFEIASGSISGTSVTLNINTSSTSAIFTAVNSTNTPTGSVVDNMSFTLDDTMGNFYIIAGARTVTATTASSVTFTGELQDGTSLAAQTTFPASIDTSFNPGFSIILPTPSGGGEPAALANQNVTGPSVTTNYTDTLTSIDENTNSTDIAAASFMNNGIRNANIMVTGTWQGTTTSSSTASETTTVLAENITSTITESTGSVSVPSTNPQTVKTKDLQGTFTAEEGNWNKSTSVLAGDGTQYTTYRTRLVEKL